MKPKQNETLNEKDASQASIWSDGTIGDGLDRIENLVGRIGMNSPEQTQVILEGLDELSARIRALENLSSQKTLQVQLQAVLARLHKDARGFLRDLGGIPVLEAKRADKQPPRENSWWYLDDYLARRRQANLKSTLRTWIVAAVILALLAVVYQLFLAPDPAFVARLGHEQEARDALMMGNIQEAQAEIEQGLQYDAQDLDLLILKGVALQAVGKTGEAQAVFDQAAVVAPNQEVFLLGRSQGYLLVSDFEDAVADVEAALAINPQSASAYLLLGQISETRQDYLLAYDSYEKAATLAEEQDQIELTALARTRLAYLSQIMNSPQLPTP